MLKLLVIGYWLLVIGYWLLPRFRLKSKVLQSLITHRQSLILLIGFLLMTSCNTTKFLKEDEILLTKNNIELETDAKKAEIGSLSYNLSTLVKQKPNKKSLGFTRARLWWYYRAHQHIDNSTKLDTVTQRMESDTSRFYKVVLKRFAESPAIYDLNKMDATAQSMEYYLNNRGFYEARVDASVRIKKRFAEVTYKVRTDSFMRIADVEYETEDLNIQQELDRIKRGSLLQPKLPLDSRTFNSEKNRVVKLLQNEGYRFFYPTNIIYEGDSSGLGTKVKAVILPPTDSTFHQKYHIGEIYVHTKYSPSQNIRTEFDTVQYQGLYLIKRKGEGFHLKEKTLRRSIFVQEDSLFRLKNLEQTNRRLSKLGVYKFVSIKSILSNKPNDDRNFIDFNIYLTPDEKMTLSSNQSVDYISGDNLVTEALGLFVNMNYRNRNVFRGGQILSLSAGYGIEMPIGRDSLLGFRDRFTQDIKVQADLALPPFSNNGNFRFTTAFNQVQRFNQYRYNLITAEMGIDWKLPNNQTFTITPTSLNYLGSKIDPDFKAEQLDPNPLYARSFDPQLIFGSSAAYSKTKQNSRTDESMSFRANVEAVGALLNLVDRLIDPANPFVFGSNQDIHYAQYAKLEIEGKYFKTFNRNLTLGARINSGIGVPYGNSSERGLPYIKQFFSGGNTSVRAWRVRQLGPGGQPDPNLVGVYPFQTGDFKFEGNLESRFSLDFLLSGLEGAAFVDFGNVWALTDTSDNNIKLIKPGNFLKRIGVGAGGGVRLDLSFFILRVDYAWKVWRPYSATGDDSDLSTYWESAHTEELRLSGAVVDPFWKQGRLSLAIGYPF